MFTGIVEEMGRIERIEERPAGRRFWIAAGSALEGTGVGDSIAVNGCCLTVVGVDARRFAVEAVPETLSRTTLGGWSEGDPVNLERSLRLDDRLGGHLVVGHVDGVGEVLWVRDEGDGRRMGFRAPAALARFIAEKGSIAVDGTSLTIAACRGEEFEIAYIPHTLAVTDAGRYAAGTRVHLEVDLIARYVARLLDAAGAAGRTS
jgi:riboflavin synthase